MIVIDMLLYSTGQLSVFFLCSFVKIMLLTLSLLRSEN